MRFILADELLELHKGTRAAARKRIRPDEDYLQDHFPGFAVVPGVLLVESMAQTAGWLISYTLDFRVWGILSMVERAKFRSFVRPGDETRIEAELRDLGHRAAKTHGRIRVGGKVVATADLVHSLMSPDAAAGQLPDGPTRTWIRETWQALGGPALVRSGEGPP